MTDLSVGPPRCAWARSTWPTDVSLVKCAGQEKSIRWLTFVGDNAIPSSQRARQEDDGLKYPACRAPCTSTSHPRQVRAERAAPPQNPWVHRRHNRRTVPSGRCVAGIRGVPVRPGLGGPGLIGTVLATLWVWHARTCDLDHTRRRDCAKFQFPWRVARCCRASLYDDRRH